MDEIGHAPVPKLSSRNYQDGSITLKSLAHPVLWDVIPRARSNLEVLSEN